MSLSHKQIILTSSPDGPITAYDVSLGNPLAGFSGSRSPRHGLITVGKSFIAASHVSLTTGSGSIHLYNWYSPTPSHNLPLPEPVAPLASTPDGLYVFAGGISGAIHVLKVPSGDIIRSVRFHSKPVSCLGINEDGSVLISGGDDGKMVMMPIFKLVDDNDDDDDDKNETDFMLNRFCAHDGSVTAIACSGSMIISCSVDCTSKIWNFLSGSLLQRLEFPSEILCVAVAAELTNTLLYFAGSDGSIYKGSLNFCGNRDPVSENSSNLICLNCKHDSPVVSIAMANDDKNLVMAAEEGSLLIWETETGKIKTVLGGNGIGSSISDMVVVSTAANGHRCCCGSSEASMNKGDDSVGANDEELSTRLLNMKMEHTLHLEDVLMVAKKDESKAVDMLESAISMYEKLLELLLKEAQRGSCFTGVQGDDDDDERTEQN